MERVLAQALRNVRALRAIHTPIGTAALQRLETDLRTFGVDYAMWAFLGQFTGPADRNKVETIIHERSVNAMLDVEFKPAELETAV